MAWVSLGLLLIIIAVVLIVSFWVSNASNKKTLKNVSYISFAIFMIGVMITCGISKAFPPEFVKENMVLVSEKTLKTFTSEKMLYIDGNGSYICTEDYLLSLDSDRFYEIQTFDEIFEDKSGNSFYVVRTDEVTEFKLLGYNYKNTVYFCNWFSPTIDVLLIPEVYE